MNIPSLHACSNITHKGQEELNLIREKTAGVAGGPSPQTNDDDTYTRIYQQQNEQRKTNKTDDKDFPVDKIWIHAVAVTYLFVAGRFILANIDLPTAIPAFVVGCVLYGLYLLYICGFFKKTCGI